MSQKLKDLVGGSGVANWSFVENVSAGTGTGQSGSSSYSLDVFKCAGSGTDANDSGTDWYFALEIPVPDGASTSSFGAFEDYEGSTNKRFRRPCASASTSAPVGTGFWRTDTLASYASVTGARRGATAVLNTTGFSYWLKLTKNAVHYATRVGSTSSNWGAHLMDSLISAYSDGCPLCIVDTSTSSAAFSRLPGVTDATVSKWVSATSGAWTLQEGSNAVNENDYWQGGKGVAARIRLTHVSGATNMRLAGGMRGLIKADFLAIPTGGTVELGDTTVIDGNTWTVIGKDSFGAVNLTSHIITRPV
jgi:hypothetical protein